MLNWGGGGIIRKKCNGIKRRNVFIKMVVDRPSLDQNVLATSGNLLNAVKLEDTVLFLSCRRVLNVIYSFLGNSPASEF